MGSNGVVVGISGGLDSTLALLVSVSAMKLLGKNNSDILALQCRGSAQRTGLIKMQSTL